MLLFHAELCTTRACLEHSYFLKVKVKDPAPHNKVQIRSPWKGQMRVTYSPLGRTDGTWQNSNYELFNRNNFNIRYWSWNYRGCWHQTCPPIDTWKMFWTLLIPIDTWKLPPHMAQVQHEYNSEHRGVWANPIRQKHNTETTPFTGVLFNNPTLHNHNADTIDITGRCWTNPTRHKDKTNTTPITGNFSKIPRLYKNASHKL